MDDDEEEQETRAAAAAASAAHMFALLISAAKGAICQGNLPKKKGGGRDLFHFRDLFPVHHHYHYYCVTVIFAEIRDTILHNSAISPSDLLLRLLPLLFRPSTVSFFVV